MGKKLYRKILAACFLAFAALFTVVGSMLISSFPPIRDRLIAAIIGLTAIGLLLSIVGLLKTQSLRRFDATPNASPDEILHPLAFLQRSHFWGGILLVSALPMFLLNRYQQASTEAAPEPPPRIEIATFTPPPEFPAMRLQGLVCNHSRSTAVIDGETVEVGDLFHGVRIVAIDASGVTLEMAGLTNILKLN